MCHTCTFSDDLHVQRSCTEIIDYIRVQPQDVVPDLKSLQSNKSTLAQDAG